MSKGLSFICLLFLLSGLLLATQTATAADATVSFSDTNLVGGQILIYSYNGTFIGQYNTTDSGVIIPDQAVIVFKPARTDFIKNPLLIPQFLVALAGAFSGYIVVAIICGGTALLVVKAFR